MGALAPPGMKPDPNGGFKVAGAHPDTFLLENENGARAVIETDTLSCSSWTTAGGKQMMSGKTSILQCFPDAATPLKGHFVPEERAKKLSFDRMIYKVTPEGTDIEYRVDVTLRDTTLEYDVIVKNLGAAAVDVSCGIKLDGLANGAKISTVKGYTNKAEKAVSTAKWSVPVGKFKETAFYVKIDSA